MVDLNAWLSNAHFFSNLERTTLIIFRLAVLQLLVIVGSQNEVMLS